MGCPTHSYLQNNDIGTGFSKPQGHTLAYAFGTTRHQDSLALEVEESRHDHLLCADQQKASNYFASTDRLYQSYSQKVCVGALAASEPKPDRGTVADSTNWGFFQPRHRPHLSTTW